MDLYLAETAQNFCQLPQCPKIGTDETSFGIAQTGKAFRNEIVARQFIFRMREFEQMEMHLHPTGNTKEWYEHWKERLKWHQTLGLGTKTIDSTTKNSPIMLMQPPISNSNSPLDLKS